MIMILDTRRLIMAVKTKPITSTPIITGKYAKQIIKEADVKPSKKALQSASPAAVNRPSPSNGRRAFSCLLFDHRCIPRFAYGFAFRLILQIIARVGFPSFRRLLFRLCLEKPTQGEHGDHRRIVLPSSSPSL